MVTHHQSGSQGLSVSPCDGPATIILTASLLTSRHTCGWPDTYAAAAMNFKRIINLWKENPFLFLFRFLKKYFTRISSLTN